jgi:hypothetical protein
VALDQFRSDRSSSQSIEIPL